MTKNRLVKSKRPARSDYMAPDGTLTIHVRGTNHSYCRIKPLYIDGRPVVGFYKTDQDDEETLVLMFGLGGIYSLIRWLPTIVSEAKRLQPPSA